MGKKSREKKRRRENKRNSNLEDKTVEQIAERQISNPNICIGDYSFPEKAIKQASISTHTGDRYSFDTADIQIDLGPDSRWDYAAEATLDENGERLMTGICTNAKVTDGRNLSISLNGPFWKLQHSYSSELGLFGMSPKEMRYCILTFNKMGLPQNLWV